MRLQRRILKAEHGIEYLAESFGMDPNEIIEMFDQELIHYKTYNSCTESNEIIEDLKSTFKEL